MIRRAVKEDLEKILDLLLQVHKVHSDERPDIFVPGERKYSSEDVLKIIEDDMTPVFVYEDSDGIVSGYAFCVYKITERQSGLRERKTMYIDDLCVDENSRGKHIGKTLYDFVVEESKRNGCDSVTLNVWNFNTSAMEFYRKRGMKPLKTVMEQII